MFIRLVCGGAAWYVFTYISWERGHLARGDATEGGTPSLPGAQVTPGVNSYGES